MPVIGSNLPSRPAAPSDPGDNATPNDIRKYDKQMLEYQDNLARYNRTLQFIQQQQSEEQAARSNVDKSRHDAMMGIVNNLKA